MTFAEALVDAPSFAIDGRKIPVIGRSALIRNKRAAGRAQDLADAEALEAKPQG